MISAYSSSIFAQEAQDAPATPQSAAELQPAESGPVTETVVDCCQPAVICRPVCRPVPYCRPVPAYCAPACNYGCGYGYNYGCGYNYCQPTRHCYPYRYNRAIYVRPVYYGGCCW